MHINTNRKLGFTLIEIMIVVAIIGFLALVAIPNFVKARRTAQKNACIFNLRQIHGAKQAWALETKKAVGAAVDADATAKAEVELYIKGGAPKCPATGTYTYGVVGAAPSCSLNATPTFHVLK